MTFIKKNLLEVVITTLGITLFIIGLVTGANVVLFNLDGFYFFVAGILLAIYGIGSLISKIKEQKKANS